jgi:hypothetical protein
MTANIQLVRIVDLIEAGLLPRTAKLHGYYGPHRIAATLKDDGTFTCGSTVSSSPSVAAGRAITTKFGQRSPGRSYYSVNGWLFWKVTGRDGKTRTLADLRKEFFEAQQPAGIGRI